MGVSDSELRKKIDGRRYTKDGYTIDEVANNLALDKVMCKYGPTHAITFHSSISRAEGFRERHERYFTRVRAMHVNGRMTSKERQGYLREFRDEPRAIMTNARCLTEGIDVPAIDCVYFCDPKYSKVDIVQASGRALRTAKDRDKKLGYVVVPVFHRDRLNVENAVEKSVFSHVVSVARALADQDERIEAEIQVLFLGKGRRPKSGQRSVIQLDGERLEILGFEASLRKALFLQVVSAASVTWEARGAELRAYKREFGNLRVPKDAPNPWNELGTWVDQVVPKSDGEY